MAGNTDGEVVIKIDLSSDDAERELSRLKKKLLSLEEDLTVGQNKKDALTQKLESYKKALENVQSQTKYKDGKYIISPENVQRISELHANIAATEKEIEKQNAALENTKMAIDGVKMRYAEVSVLAKRSSFGGSISALGEKLRNIAGGIAGGLKTCVTQLNRMFGRSKSLSKSFGGIGAAVKRIAPALLATEGVIGILRKAVNAYMQQNQQLANTLSSAWTGLGNILGPVIDRMVNLLANAIAYFTKFLNLLGFTGKTAAKQIGSAGGAAKKESDELKKQLMSFDELNILRENESDSGGGGGGGADTGITPNVQLPDWAQLMAQQLRSSQWSEAATTLTTALNNMVDSVDWGGIGAKIGFWLNGAMSFLATAINTFDWQGLGGRLATAVNNLISSVNCSNLGTILAGKFKIILSTLSGFILNLDMVELAHAASSVAISFVNSISQTLQEIDWQAIGGKIAEFLVNIDWEGIATAVWNAAVSAVKAVLSAAWVMIKELFAPYIEQFKQDGMSDADAIAGGIVVGLITGILKAIVGIATWVNEHIFKPIKDAICDAFGIHSPSTVAAEWGGYIIEGLLNGITGAWQRVKEWFSTALSDIKNAFSNAWTSIRDTTSRIWYGIAEAIRGAVNGVIRVINRMISAVVSGINNLFSLLSFSIDLPGGHSIGLSLPQFTAPQIPYLAQGAVIPPNAPFAAVLGDQRHGNNIEAPEDLIRKIVREEAAGGASNDEIVALLRELIEVVMGIKIGDETIGKAALRYTRRYNRAMGV